MSQLAREVILGSTADLHEAADFTRSQSAYARTSRLSYDDLESATTPLLGDGASHVAEQVAAQADRARDVEAFSHRVRIGIRASWVVNCLLLVSKTAVFLLSGSYAVLASAVDSLVDLLSQAVLATAEYQVARFDQRFPIGRTRLSELSVMACACIMFVSTSMVLREAVEALWNGFHGNPPDLQVDAVLFGVLGGATLFKLLLYVYCRVLRKNPIMVALSEDHLNDVQSNVAAVAGAAIAGYLPKYWWADPVVAILFSLLIIKSWIGICWEQAQKMIGLAAPDELVEEVSAVTTTHHAYMQLDRVTAYHHGSHMVVEVEVLLPAEMSVKESHDIALALQHKIEAIDSVERAFVHVDYARRYLEEHKVERNLKLGEKDVMKPIDIADYDPTTGQLVTPSPSTSNGGGAAGGSRSHARSPGHRSRSAGRADERSSSGGAPGAGPGAAGEQGGVPPAEHANVAARFRSGDLDSAGGSLGSGSGSASGDSPSLVSRSANGEASGAN
ncbi:hypothetical protein HYH03_004208 [Edaphochlamys debaryana]|uniref:Cation efflux protein cytoplasmic domain-containing protein n=1 Tax=Edaphochlamys debaryana TaxID=47281 RepID=A0A835YBT7_9CHLO|nr:hypothetical protein HYH03_004208 [Edaphochlamys debaryana]|eukprot:KAG2497946.1 hypothetical protein HYH03_004208 [Edaphochlamys debaryana]